nr:hypothetical protein [Acidobacteriota bacterium]
MSETSMERAVAFVLLAFLLSPAALRALTPWEAYVALPSPENAGRVDRLAYGQAGPRQTGSSRDAFTDLGLLGVQALAGDRQAVRLLFSLAKPAAGLDAALLQALCKILGQLSRVQPRLFLEEIPQRVIDREALDIILGEVDGRIYQGSSLAPAHEIEARIKALREVANPRLRKVRTECIASLESW